MAAVRAEVFLALEASLTQRLQTTFLALTSRLVKAMGKAVDEGEYEKARRLLDQIDLDDVYVLNEDYIRYVSYIAMLFGASRVTDDPVNSAVGLGFEKDLVEQVMQSFKVFLQVNAEETIKGQLLQLIAVKESPPVMEPGYLGTVLKADKKARAVLPFESFMEASGKAFFNMASSLHTSRLSAYGYTAEARYLGITHYKIDEQLDGRTCPVCEHMDGKTFLVSDARNLLDIVVRTQDPDELKNLQPWPKQSKAAMAEFKELTNDKLVSKGWHVPPFHPRCRGLLSKATSKAVTTTAEASPTTSQYEATAEDFDQLGTPLSPAKVKLWNQLMQTSPAEAVSRISGTPLEDLLSEAMQDGPTAQNIGLKTLSVNSSGVNIELQRKMHGSKHAVATDLYFRKDKTLFVGSVEVSQNDGYKVLKDTLKAIYGLARNTAMNRIKMVAGADMSGYAFAKYGLAPDIDAWDNVKAQISRIAKKENLLEAMSETQAKVFKAILDSDDPKNIFALADMPVFGKKLLAGTTYTTYLDFDDPESLTRFLAFIGA
jgi:hypothetical protein